MDIKEIEKLIQSGRNTPLTSFPNKPPKIELHTVVDVSSVCASAGRHTNELFLCQTFCSLFDYLPFMV